MDPIWLSQYPHGAHVIPSILSLMQLTLRKFPFGFPKATWLVNSSWGSNPVSQAPKNTHPTILCFKNKNSSFWILLVPPTVSSRRWYPWRPRAPRPPGQPGAVQPESSNACFHTFKFILNSCHWRKGSLSLFFLCIKFQLASMAESSWTWPWNDWSIIRLVVSLARLTLSAWHPFRSDFLGQSCFAPNTSVVVTTECPWEYTSMSC